jgi:uncharacterized HhH-GPD family protein
MPDLHLAQEPDADALLNRDPFSVAVGMLLDQQYGMEHAFRGPWKLATRMGTDTLDLHAIAAADPEAFADLCSTPPAIHRYARSMAGRVQGMAQHVLDHYDGDITQLWATAKTGAELYARLAAIPGWGDMKAKIFTALLAKQLDVAPKGWKAAAGDYALKGRRSIADVTDPVTLMEVRTYKQAMKKAAKG